MTEDTTPGPDPEDPPSHEELRRWLAGSGDAPTDEMGVTARLESRGFTDGIARRHYGAEDLFSLAEELHADLRGSGVAQEPLLPRSPLPLTAHVARGVTYLVPAALIVLATEADAGTSPLLWFAALTCVGWGSTQGLARIAYAAIGRGGVDAAGRYLAGVVLGGAAAAVVVGVAVAAAVGSADLGLVVGAQVGYLALSAVALPLRRELSVVLAMAPAVVATVGVLVADVSMVLAAGLAVGGELLLTASVLPRLLRARADAAVGPDRRDVAEAAPVLVLGAAAGAFVLGVTVVVAENVGRSGPVVALAVVLTLCMGVAEVQIATARDQLDATLRRSTTTVEFTRTARRVLAGHSLGFLAVLVLALGVTAGVTDLDAGAAAAVASTMVLLGWCLYLNLCLLIIEHVAPALVAFCGAAILLTALLALSEDVGHVVIGVAAVAAGGLWLSVRSSVARPEGHVFG